VDYIILHNKCLNSAIKSQFRVTREWFCLNYMVHFKMLGLHNTVIIGRGEAVILENVMTPMIKSIMPILEDTVFMIANQTDYYGKKTRLNNKESLWHTCSTGLRDQEEAGKLLRGEKRAHTAIVACQS